MISYQSTGHSIPQCCRPTGF